MKRVLFSLIACFCFLSANTQVLNLYLKGGVLPINTYDIDSIRLVPEQEIPTYDVKGILTSAEDGWVYGNIKGLWTYSVLKFLNEGFVSVQDYHINNDSLSLYNTNLYSFSISPTNRLLLSGDYNYSGDNQYSEYIITDINEERIALACCYSLNNTPYSSFPQYIVLEHNNGVAKAIHNHFLANLSYYYLYNLSKDGLCIGKSIQSIKDLDSSVNWLSSSISFNPANAPLFSNQNNQYRLHVEDLHYDETAKGYQDREGTIALGYSPHPLSRSNDSLVLELCSPKVQDAINNLENLHQEYFPSQSKFSFSFGKSSESGAGNRTGLCLTARRGTSRYSMAASGSYNDFLNLMIHLAKDENGNYDWSSNYINFANKGMGDALNEVVSLFEGEFRKEPAYLTSTPGYFKLISTSDPDIYFTWYIR